jgi:hypothetical protein
MAIQSILQGGPEEMNQYRIHECQSLGKVFCECSTDQGTELEVIRERQTHWLRNFHSGGYVQQETNGQKAPRQIQETEIVAWLDACLNHLLGQELYAFQD